MNALRGLWLPLLLAALLLAGCQSGSDSGKDKVYDIKGKVVEVDAARKKVRLDHEDIPGLMRAMEMSFSSMSPTSLSSRQPGNSRPSPRSNRWRSCGKSESRLTFWFAVASSR